jgi:hypothetical protein
LAPWIRLHCVKKIELDPDPNPHLNQCGSTTLQFRKADPDPNPNLSQSQIRIRNILKIQDSGGSKKICGKPWTLTMEALWLKMEPWRV